jgi:hypothetical protein
MSISYLGIVGKLGQFYSFSVSRDCNSPTIELGVY